MYLQIQWCIPVTSELVLGKFKKSSVSFTILYLKTNWMSKILLLELWLNSSVDLYYIFYLDSCENLPQVLIHTIMAKQMVSCDYSYWSAVFVSINQKECIPFPTWKNVHTSHYKKYISCTHIFSHLLLCLFTKIVNRIKYPYPTKKI